MDERGNIKPSNLSSLITLKPHLEGLQLGVQLHDLVIQAEIIHREGAHVLQTARHKVRTNKQTNKETNMWVTSAERVTVPSSLPGASPMLLSCFEKKGNGEKLSSRGVRGCV